MRCRERLPVCVDVIDDAHDEGTKETTLRQRQPPRCGGRRRAAAREPLRGNAAGRRRDVRGRRDYRLGLLGGADPAFELGVEAERRERPLPGGTDHGARARATVRW